MLRDSITCIIPLRVLFFCNLDFKFPPWSNYIAFDSPVPWVHGLLFPLRLMISARLMNKRGRYAVWCSAFLTNALYAQPWPNRLSVSDLVSQAFFSLLFMWDTFSYKMPVQPAQQDSAEHGPHGEVLRVAGFRVSSWVNFQTAQANQNQCDSLLPSVPTFSTT